MLLPIGDDNRDRRTTPYINYVLIGLNILVFVFLQGLGSNYEFTYAFATVPAEIVTGKDLVTQDRVVQDPLTGQRFRLPGLQVTPITVYITLITSMFMHGGIAHIFGNLLFLFVFGDNIEDRLGHLRYLIFYLVCGILASLVHVYSSLWISGDIYIPTLGASGAISGILGGYIVLFPKRRVNVLFFRILVRMPAFMALGIWFVFQLISGIGVLGSGSQAGGVAYGAHIGGFIAGCILIKLFDRVLKHG